MKEIKPAEVAPEVAPNGVTPTSEHETEEEIEMPGAWIFAMLADLGIGPYPDEIAEQNEDSQHSP